MYILFRSLVQRLTNRLPNSSHTGIQTRKCSRYIIKSFFDSGLFNDFVDIHGSTDKRNVAILGFNFVIKFIEI